MSTIQNELDELTQNADAIATAKTNIANAITAKGGTVSTGDGLLDFANDISSIPSGSTSPIKIVMGTPVSGGFEFDNETQDSIFQALMSGLFVVVLVIPTSATARGFYYPTTLNLTYAEFTRVSRSSSYNITFYNWFTVNANNSSNTVTAYSDDSVDYDTGGPT